jgi:membrane-bound lytic murein transglycosylase B
MRLCLALLLLLCLPAPAHAAGDFARWLNGVKYDAAEAGVSPATLEAALAGIDGPDPNVLAHDRAQAEGRMTFPEYRARIVSPARIQRGRELYNTHRALLRDIEARTGVAGQYIVALWGVESSFGANTGEHRVIPSLATLAYDGRRADFFRAELIAALQIIDAGHVAAGDMTGSWAGAMGQVQFMPTSFLALAVDGDGDGRADIWGSEADALASAANYLRARGWQAGERWGRAVVLPPGFDADLLGRDKKRPLSAWQAMGVRLPGGGDLPAADMAGGIVVPAGDGPGDGQAFLVYANYDVLMDWNRSLYFATSVGLLADAIAAGP